ncbi:MAG: protein-glutamate O-methyltransferase CheR [Acidobacteria bacterium]|nr:protein-glutamate O-methyltransferase CheR [Acidobacteriota bacterium]
MNFSIAGAPGLTDEEFRILRDYIYRRCGMYFEDSKKFYLEHKLGTRLKELGSRSFSQYFMEIQQSGGDETEIQEIFNTVTTTETSFYRNAPQMQTFRNLVLPEVVENKFSSGNRTLKIWSAGCATGEEPYTLAMLVLEGRSSFPSDLRIEITASDINRSVMNAAERGIYTARAAQRLPVELRERYMTPHGDGFRVNREVRDMITFRFFNLANGTRYLSFGKMDIVFCRNVLIYFAEASRRKALEDLSRVLNPNGFLFVGYSENALMMSSRFSLVYYNKRPVCYRMASSKGSMHRRIRH